MAVFLELLGFMLRPLVSPANGYLLALLSRLVMLTIDSKGREKSITSITLPSHECDLYE